MAFIRNGLTKEQQAKHVADYFASGLTQAQYAANNSLPVSALGYWIKQHREKNKAIDTRVNKVIDAHFTSDTPNWRKLYEDECAKNEALQKVILVLGYQL